MDLKLLVDRHWKKNDYTIGKFYINDTCFSESLEDKDRNLSDDMSEWMIRLKKIYGKTAIPTGTYEVKLTYSPKFAGRVWGKKYNGQVPEIINVKGFSGVRIHPFNRAEESLGCISVGRNLEKGKVLQATTYYYKLMDDYLIPAFNKGEKVFITIR